MVRQALLDGALGALGLPPRAADVPDGRAELLTRDADARNENTDDASRAQHIASNVSEELSMAAVARVGSDFGILALPSGDAGVQAAYALVNTALLPMAEQFAVAPKQRDEARKALVHASLALEQLVQGRRVRVAPVVLDIHPIVASRIDECGEAAVTVDSFEDGTCDDLAILNELQAHVGRWNREIDRVMTALREGPGAVLSAEEETLFWTSVDVALDGAQRGLKSKAVSITMQILARKRRATGFLADATETLERGRRDAQGLLRLVSGLPIEPLRISEDVSALASAVQDLLAHVSSKLRVSYFSLDRALALVVAVSMDVVSSTKDILSRHGGLLGQPKKTFRSNAQSCQVLFDGWDSGFRTCHAVALDAAKARNQVLKPIQPTDFPILQRRISDIVHFRNQHDSLCSVLEGLDDLNGFLSDHAVDEGIGIVTAAYASLRAKFYPDDSILDTSAEGEEAWLAAVAEYFKAVATTEASLADAFLSQLEASDTLRSKRDAAATFVPLLDRQAFAEVLESVLPSVVEMTRDEIATIRAKTDTPTHRSASARSNTVAGDREHYLRSPVHQVVTQRQLGNAAREIVSCVTGIIGEARANADLDVLDLKSEAAALADSLNPVDVVTVWVADATELAQFRTASCVLQVQEEHGRQRLAVSLDHRALAISRDAELLIELGFHDCPEPLLASGRPLRCIREPLAMLLEGVHAYDLAMESLSAHTSSHDAAIQTNVLDLVAECQLATCEQIEKGLPLRWSSSPEELEEFAFAVLSSARSFLDQAEFATHALTVLAESLSNVERCAWVVQYSGIDGHVRKQLVDELGKIVELGSSVTSNPNLTQPQRFLWTHLLPRLDRALIRGLRDCLASWIQQLQGGGLRVPAVVAPVSHRLEGLAILQRCDSVRDGLTASLLGLFYQFQRLRNVYETMFGPADSATGPEADPSALSAWLFRSTNGQKLLGLAFQQIEYTVASLRNVLEDWAVLGGAASELSFSVDAAQDTDSVEHHFGLLEELHSLETTLKSLSERCAPLNTLPTFGLSVDVEATQMRILAQLKRARRQIAEISTSSAHGETRTVYSKVADAHAMLRDSSQHVAMDAVLMLTAIDRDVLGDCTARADRLALLESVIQAENPTGVPDDWIDVSTIRAVLDALRTTYQQRHRVVLSDKAELEAQCRKQLSSLERQMAELYADVAKLKQRSNSDGTLDDVFADVEKLGDRLAGLNSATDRISSVASVIGIEVKISESELDLLADELAKMKHGLMQVTGVTQELDELSAQALGSARPKDLRVALDALQERIDSILASHGELSKAEELQTYITRCQACHSTLSSLAAVRLSGPREHEVLQRLFGENVRYAHLSEVPVGDIWKCELSKNERYLRTVFESAAEETALAGFLGSIADFWSTKRADFIERNRVWLVKGIPEILDQVLEHLNALAAMSGSASARLFESERASWEQRLSRLRDELESWTDVQTRWLHLSSLFGDDSASSRSLRTQLSQEYSSFMSVHKRFIEFCARARAAPAVLEILEKPSGLDRMSFELNAVVRGLGRFLENQRSTFPRFFYLSDEDLLAVLCVGPRNIEDMNAHWSKLYSGVCRVEVADCAESEEASRFASTITAVVSKEGETLELCDPVRISHSEHITIWLVRLEAALSNSLRDGLSSTLQAAEHGLYVKPDVEISDEASSVADFLGAHVAQLILLSCKIIFTSEVEKCLASKQCDSDLRQLSAVIESALHRVVLSGSTEPAPHSTAASVAVALRREQLIKELVYQGKTVQALIAGSIANPGRYFWRKEARFYRTSPQSHSIENVEVQIADATLPYMWEYLGIGETLVQTPLTSRCFLTLAQALKQGLGGSPFGPAGTGKTESVKALGRLLGAAVTVFNCDETFDAVAVGRILAGVARTGGWVCFDEFNRLSSGSLSSVSSQLSALQSAIQKGQNSIANFYGGGDAISLSSGVGVFVTMNPTYSGRRELPTNLRSLFRPVAMSKPDIGVIAEVTLLAFGFRLAGQLSSKVVAFFRGLAAILPTRSHYDFGLRALKCAIAAAGSHLRAEGSTCQVSEGGDSPAELEISCLAQAIQDTIRPTLDPVDVECFASLHACAFGGSRSSADEMAPDLVEALLVEGESLGVEVDDAVLEKVGELYTTFRHRQAIILVGPSSSGKTTTWKLLFGALRRMAGRTESDADPGVLQKFPARDAFRAHIMDPKLLGAVGLYGSLDPTTREWTDGAFSSILRSTSDTEASSAHPTYSSTVPTQWIVFDGDIDPDWAENLNSVLDDNKVLTLPSGERLPLPPTTLIVFETDSVQAANPSTVSRCGIVCFAEQRSPLLLAQQLYRKLESDLTYPAGCLALVGPLIPLAVGAAVRVRQLPALMVTSPTGLVEAIFAMFAGFLRQRHDGAEDCADGESKAPATDTDIAFSVRAFVAAVLSLIGGSLDENGQRSVGEEFLDAVSKVPGIDTTMAQPEAQDCECGVSVDIVSGEYVSFAAILDQESGVEVDAAKVGDPDVIVPTTTTIKHRHTVSGLASGFGRGVLVLCGPPGCGKSMIMEDTLRSMSDVDVASMTFSSTTSPRDILAMIRSRCAETRLPSGVTCLRPKVPGSRIVLFCDEVNLCRPDAYGTQLAISFLRQLVEHSGFWDKSEWVQVEGVQVVAACNPPSLAGRQPLPERFMRHACVVRVDLPGPRELTVIYRTLCESLLSAVNPDFAALAESLAQTMIQVYLRNREEFAPDLTGPRQPHYVYSPRDLSRVLRGMRHILLDASSSSADRARERPSSQMLGFPGQLFGSASTPGTRQVSRAAVVESFAHEVRRLFIDRLVTKVERRSAEEILLSALASGLVPKGSRVPEIWYSAWPREARDEQGVAHYQAVSDIEALRRLVYRKLRLFSEEQGLGGAWMTGSAPGDDASTMIDQFAVTDDVLRHLTRLERVLRLPVGHAVLIGAPGSGKKTLARFAAWMAGMSVFQIRSHANYSSEDFADDLRQAMTSSGVADKPVVMIFDESAGLDGAFLEMMNAILASGDVPGLFDGDQRAALLGEMRKLGRLRLQGASADSTTSSLTDDRLYEEFVRRVRCNLHIVFTLPSEPSDGSDDGAVAADGGSANLLSRSPALYNRCVVNWMGDWDEETLTAVADLKLEVARGAERDQIVSAVVQIHNAARRLLAEVCGSSWKVTPRYYLEFVEQLNRIALEKAADIQGGASRLKDGLGRLRSAGTAIDALKEELAANAEALATKEEEANKTLEAMANEQRLAEKAKVDAETLASGAEEAAEAARERTQQIELQLADVEPKVLAAREAVGSIRKENLEELRAMPSPPPSVRLAMEAVVTLLDAASGRPVKNSKWGVLRSRMRGADFIQSVINFDPDTIPRNVLDHLNKAVIRNADFDVGRISYASRAAGPLAEWTLACVDYAAVIDAVSPLRVEADSLHEEHQTMLSRRDSALDSIAGLEEKIENCRLQYSALVSEAESIRRNIADAERRIEAAERTVESLADEWDRWMGELSAINRTATVVWGNSLLGAAFVAYAGMMGQSNRERTIATWIDILSTMDIKVEDGIRIGEFLTSASERSAWAHAGLPMDARSVENYAILKRSARYPLIVDQSQGMEPVVRAIVASSRTDDNVRSAQDQSWAQVQRVQLVKTSFTGSGKSSHLRVLESAMRFGTAAMVFDAEHLDATVLPLLGQEATTGHTSDTASSDSGLTPSGASSTAAGPVHRVVRLGDRDVDQSPSFRLFLCASSLEKVPRSAVSRCCPVSFSFSTSNLSSMCLSRALRVVSPDLEQRRSNLTAARNALEVKKIVMEDRLLSTLVNAEQNEEDLLDGPLLDTLNMIKEEARSMEDQISEGSSLMAEVDALTNRYSNLVHECVSVYFGLENPTSVNRLYALAPEAFLDVFDTCVRRELVVDETDEGDHISFGNVVDVFHRDVYDHVGASMFPDDRVVFGAILTLFCGTTEIRGATDQIFEKDRPTESHLREAMGHLASISSGTALSDRVCGLVRAVSVYADRLLSDMSLVHEAALDIGAFLPGADGEARMGPNPERILGKVIRDYAQHNGSGKATVRPLLLCSRGTGANPSNFVTELADQHGIACESIALGDLNSTALTQAALEYAANEWGPAQRKRSSMGRSDSTAPPQRGILLLKNAHLAPPDCVETIRAEVLKYPEGMSYILAIACETGHDGTLAGLNGLAFHCRVLTFEASAIFRTTLERTLELAGVGDPARRAAPQEFYAKKALVGVSWLHASLLERARYAPIGFSRQYGFSDADLAMACKTVASVFSADVDSASSSSAEHYAVCFETLERMLADSIYGGQVDTEADAEIVQSLAADIFSRCVQSSDQAPEQRFLQVVGDASDSTGNGSVPGVKLPIDGPELLECVAALPSSAPASWFGLGRHSDKQRRTRSGRAVAARMTRMYTGTPTMQGHRAGSNKGANDAHGAALAHVFGELATMAPPEEQIDDLGALVDQLSKHGGLSELSRYRLDEARTLLCVHHVLVADLRDAAAALRGERCMTDRLANIVSCASTDAFAPVRLHPSWINALQLAPGSPLLYGLDCRRLMKLLCAVAESQAEYWTAVLNSSPALTLDLDRVLRPSAALWSLRIAGSRATGVPLEQLTAYLEVLPPAQQECLPTTGIESGCIVVRGLGASGTRWDDDMEAFVVADDTIDDESTSQRGSEASDSTIPLPACLLRWTDGAPPQTRALPLYSSNGTFLTDTVHVDIVVGPDGMLGAAELRKWRMSGASLRVNQIV